MTETEFEIPPNFSERTRSLITEDTNSIRNIFSSKQSRLLVEPLYSSWHSTRLNSDTTLENKLCNYLADSNVGIFNSLHKPPIAPNMFLSLDVQVDAGYLDTEHRAYFIWEFNKTPDVSVEIVSKEKCTELENKMNRYAHIGIPYYVVFDPFLVLSNEKLRVHELAFGKRRYRRLLDDTLPEIDLSLRLWRGVFEGVEAEWLRWCKADGTIIPTGEERARVAEAEIEKLRAELLQLKSE